MRSTSVESVLDMAEEEDEPPAAAAPAPSNGAEPSVTGV
jgi:hypothetical protein